MFLLIRSLHLGSIHQDMANQKFFTQLVKQRWASTTKPETLEKPILDALKA